MFFLSLIAPLCSVLAGLSSSQSTTYPLPEPCTGPACANPPAPGTLDYQDFSVIRRVSDGKYFRISKDNDTGLGLDVATAPSLRGPWEYDTAILYKQLTDPIADDTTVKLWAPEIHYVNGTYILYYSINTPDSLFDIAVATSPDLEKWQDHGSMNIPDSPGTYPDKPYVRIDGNLLASSDDPNGAADQRYMVFGSYQDGLYGCPLSEDLLSFQSGGEVQEIITDQYNPGADPGNKTEGPFQLIDGNYIYLFYSVGDCCPPDNYGYDDVYRIQVCRTTVADGPTAGTFVDRDGNNCLTGGQNRTGTVVLYSHSNGTVFAPGSPGVINDPEEGLVMYYQYRNQHAADSNLRFGWNYLSFDDEDWPVLVSRKPTNDTLTVSPKRKEPRQQYKIF